MKPINLNGKIELDDNAYFFTSDLGGDYIISLKNGIEKDLARLDKKQVSIKAEVIGSKIHIYSIEESALLF